MKKGIFVFFAFVGAALAQTPSGAIQGIVRDTAGAVVPAAEVIVESLQTGAYRPAVTTDLGAYTVSGLLPGAYRVEVKARGFHPVMRPATVETGVTTFLPFVVGELAQSVTVEGTSPQLRYDSYTVSGSILRGMIEEVPLNGRNFAELAKLE